MKKLIAAAVASSMTAFAMADISITGDAKYEYDLTDNNGDKTTTANTEAHINFTGKSGDTTAVANFQLVEQGAAADATNADGDFDMEDVYITTKVAGIGVKAGNYASGTSALAGEIEEGGRSNGKVMLSYKLGDIDVYAGNGGDSADLAGNATAADGGMNNNMFAGASVSVGGQTVQIKKNSDTLDSFGIKGSVGGVSYRYETQDDDTNGDASYGEVNASMNGITVQYATLDADVAAGLTETDSAVFALESANYSDSDGQTQVAVSTTVDGNKITVKSGTVEKGLSSTRDKDYTQLSVSRALASGATAVVTYTDQDMTTGDQTNLEIELNVKF
jgi:hypothetical protein